jgi:F420-non-reducing hydrogenase iron-sulfur subunit
MNWSVNKMPATIQQRVKTKITVFRCINALNGIELPERENCEIQSIKLPCSSMTREIFLLKAFESGADAVVVLVCPLGSCRYLEGNIRAAKRVKRVKKLLDDIGIDGRRLNIYNIPHGSKTALIEILDKTLAGLIEIGPNPAA